MRAALVYPHQLFRHHPAVAGVDLVVTVEDPLFFTQYPFHKHKLVLHRASMKAFSASKRQAGKKTRYIDVQELKSTSSIGKLLKEEGVEEVVCCSFEDFNLEKRVIQGLRTAEIKLEALEPTPMFLSPREWIDELMSKKRLFFTEFYVAQRKRLGIMLEKGDKPVGGKWSFDAENRKKLPKGIELPDLTYPGDSDHVEEAKRYVGKHFKNNPGEIANFWYPTTYDEAANWLQDFLTERFEKFGDYEDAISSDARIIFHSVLTPALNSGLITPEEVVEATLKYAKNHNIPLNSLEGFIRQVIGWREYMRGVYHAKGVKERTTNYWKFSRKLPKSFWDGSTGITPFDDAVKRVQKFSYLHHIERLMVIGNFMLLCEIDPDEVYEWFMALFIDAYDWVMVPNVYGMSQFADGGLITTKPYISSSNYIRKMSNYGSGDWCEVWDGLYWMFIEKQRDFFEKNPRMRVMPRQLDKMKSEKRERIFGAAERFLKEQC